MPLAPLAPALNRLPGMNNFEPQVAGDGPGPGARPTVSVCIPTVDRIGYLREALSSVAAQSLRDVEVLIADNSGDPVYQAAVRALVAEFASLSVRLIQHTSRLSMVDNTNVLVDAAAGQFWLYLPDDDRLQPNCLEQLLDRLERTPQAGFAWCDHWIIDADGTRNQRASLESTARFGRDALAARAYDASEVLGIALRQSFAIQCMLFRREVIQEFRFDPAFGPVLDLDLEVRMGASRRVGAVYCDQRLVEYRVHDTQFSTHAARQNALELTLRAIERSGVSARERPERDRVFARCHRSLAGESLRRRRYVSFFMHAVRSVAYAATGRVRRKFRLMLGGVRGRESAPPRSGAAAA